MRNITNRKVNREPVRSPSPDIANRNIIGHTHVPQTAEILNKSRTKYSDSAKSIVPLHFEEIQKSLIDTQQKYRELQKQLTHLLIENSNLKKENYELKDLLAKNKPRFLKPFDQSQAEATLKEYQSRFTRYSQEIKRIHELLRREKQRNEELQSQITSLKKYEPVYSSRYNKNMNEETFYNNLRLIERNLNEEFEKVKAEYQLKVHLSLNAINERLIKIERNQSSIQNTVRSQFQTPKTTKEHDRYGNSTASHYAPDSNQLKLFQKSSKQAEDEREIDMLRDKLRLNQLDLAQLKKLNQSLIIQLREKERSLFVGECHICKMYQIKIGELEKELDLLKNESRLFLERINVLQEENAELRNNHEKHNHNQTHQSEKVTFNLQDYLRRIKDVKNILNNEEFRQFLQKIHHLVTENTHLQSQLNRAIQQNQRNSKQNKNKEIELRLQLTELKRQNSMLKVENNEQQQQIDELKRIIEQQFNKPSKDHISLDTQLEQIDSVQPQTVKFKRYLSEAISHLQSMQNSLNKQAIKE